MNKKFILLASVTVLALGIASEAGAVSTIVEEGSCGSNCNYKLVQNDGVYDFIAERIDTNTNAILEKQTGDIIKKYTNTVNNISIGNGITNPNDKIGFAHLNITGVVKFPNSVTKLGGSTFARTTISGTIIFPKEMESVNGWLFDYANITGTIIFPEKISSVGQKTFQGNSSSIFTGTIILPQNGNVGANAFYNRTAGEGAKIVCVNDVDKSDAQAYNAAIAACKNKLGDYSSGVSSKVSLMTTAEYQATMKRYRDKPVGCVALDFDGNCSACEDSYRNMGEWCNKIRYTPAEAAKLLNDDNNTVTLTFKK